MVQGMYRWVRFLAFCRRGNSLPYLTYEICGYLVFQKDFLLRGLPFFMGAGGYEGFS